MTYAEPAVDVGGLVKACGGTTVLAGIDLRVERGTVFALLGPNGAGKTTMVRILATLTTADAGTARVAGYDVRRQRREVRRRISLTGQYAAVDDAQTGHENLVMVGRLVGLTGAAARRQADRLLERFDLASAGRRLVGTYSGGMRRRLDLAAGLLGNPEVVFLDEPTTGLDPRARQETWRSVAELARSGTTVFLTTQYLEEADRLAGRIAVLDGGHIVAEGSAADLKSRVGRWRVDLTASGPGAFEAILARLGGRAARTDPARLLVGVATDGSAVQVRDLLDHLDPGRDAVSSFTVHAATLDDAFLALTGHGSAAPALETSHA